MSLAQITQKLQKLKSKENKLEQKFESYFIEKNERKAFKFTKKTVTFFETFKNNSPGIGSMISLNASSSDLQSNLKKSPTQNFLDEEDNESEII